MSYSQISCCLDPTAQCYDGWKEHKGNCYFYNGFA